jgi:hypothetical protein
MILPRNDHPMPTLIRSLLPVLLVTACAGETAPPPPPPQDPVGVEILAPMPIAFRGDSITVQFGAFGATVVPATGTRVEGEVHHHLFVDVDVTPEGEPVPKREGIYHVGDGSDSVRIAVAPGRHRLIAVLAWGDHVPVAGASRDTITIEMLPPGI